MVKNNLIPDGLDEETENDYKLFCENYKLLEPYIKGNKASLYFDKENFKQDVLSANLLLNFMMITIITILISMKFITIL